MRERSIAARSILQALNWCRPCRNFGHYYWRNEALYGSHLQIIPSKQYLQNKRQCKTDINQIKNIQAPQNPIRSGNELLFNGRLKLKIREKFFLSSSVICLKALSMNRNGVESLYILTIREPKNGSYNISAIRALEDTSFNNKLGPSAQKARKYHKLRCELPWFLSFLESPQRSRYQKAPILEEIQILQVEPSSLVTEIAR